MNQPNDRDRDIVLEIAELIARNSGDRAKALVLVAELIEKEYARGVEDGKKLALQEIVRPIDERRGGEYRYLVWDTDIDSWVFASYEKANICGRSDTYWISHGSIVEPTHFAVLPTPDEVYGDGK